MAQLRDAQTSELLAEGTPEEIAVAAEAFAAGEVLFDGMGSVDSEGKSLFRPGLVRRIQADEITALEQELAAVPPEPEHEDRRERLRATVRDRRARVARGKALQTPAADAMQAARARVKP